MRVKTRRISNLYVLIIHPPDDSDHILEYAESRRPWVPFEVGETLRIDGIRARVSELALRIERRGDVVRHVVEVFTSAIAKNVVRMPAGDHSVVAQFIRYHVLMRVFDGDADAWLAHIRARGSDDGDLRFVHWVRSRLRQDPRMLASIRRMVDATPFWRAASGVR